jgi:hypothetical protein
VGRDCQVRGRRCEDDSEAPDRLRQRYHQGQQRGLPSATRGRRELKEWGGRALRSVGESIVSEVGVAFVGCGAGTANAATAAKELGLPNREALLFTAGGCVMGLGSASFNSPPFP